MFNNNSDSVAMEEESINVVASSSSRNHVITGSNNDSLLSMGETPASLRERWKVMKEPQKDNIIAFYSDWKGKAYREFSNFYQAKGHGFNFTVPKHLFDVSKNIVNEKQKQQSFTPAVAIHCNFSEKALMLCKAVAMGDAQSYTNIAMAETPQEAKRLGRVVKPWDDKLWNTVVCGVAVSMLYQKFGQVPDLKRVLLSTGNKILCEAAAHDTTWAIGISIKMDKIYNVPARWKGSNILGWALMQVHEMLRQQDEEQQQQQQQDGGGEDDHDDDEGFSLVST